MGGGHRQRRFWGIPRALDGGFWKTGLGIGTQSQERWGTTGGFYAEECFVCLFIYLFTMQNTKLYSLRIFNSSKVFTSCFDKRMKNTGALSNSSLGEKGYIYSCRELWFLLDI